VLFAVAELLVTTHEASFLIVSLAACRPIYRLAKMDNFYSASALLAMQSAVLARGILSVCLSVCPSVRHVQVLCPDE